MTRLFYLSIILVVVLGVCYIGWLERAYPPEQVCQDCPEPQPRIEDHVAQVIRQDYPACPECPTWDALRRAGVEITCENAFGEIPAVNYWPVEVPMGCNKIKKIIVTDPHIKVERKEK